MSISTMAQVASAVTNLLFVVIIGVGYFMMIRLYRQMLGLYDRTIQVMEAQRTAMGRPQVVVEADYSRLPEVDIVICNMSEGAAKDISFEFSSPIVSSDGTVLSDLSYFRDGINFLSPNDHINCYWDHLDHLIPLLEEKGQQGGITITTRYKDLGGESYTTYWTVNPYIYRDGRYIHHRDIETVSRTLDEISGDIKTFLHRREATGDGIEQR